MFTVDKLISVNCKLYIMMTQCDEHVNYQLPNKLTRVNLLLGAIEWKDPGLNAAISMVKRNKGPTGKINKSK